MAERRKHTRFDAGYRVVVSMAGAASGSVSEDGDINTLCCTTGDISLGGLRFQSQIAFIEGQTVPLEIILGQSYWGFQFKGRVAWVKAGDPPSQFEVGIEFIETPLATRLAWEEALSRDLPRRPGLA